MTPEDLRAATPATEDVAPFDTGASGPSRRPVVVAVADFAAYRASESPGGEGMYEAGGRAARETRAAVGRPLGADEAHVALTPSTTEGIALSAAGLDRRPGDVVVRPIPDPACVRTSVHGFNDERDIDRALGPF